MWLGYNLATAAVFLDFEKHLRSSQGNLTSQEANALMRLKADALRNFVIGLTGGSVVSWCASWRMNKFFRHNFTPASGFAVGLWSYARCLSKGADYVLSLEGTRMQREFETLMLTKYQHVPWLMQRFAKHFYPEEVYDDISDQPKLRWRSRNSSGESAGSTETHAYGSQAEKSNQESTTLKNQGRTTLKNQGRTTMKQDQVTSAAVDDTENPFDCIFGRSESVEVPLSDVSKASHKKSARAHKRSHRRRRKRHTEDAEA